MKRNPWERLAEILETERKAIIAGNIEELLECLKEKEKLLKDPSLKTTPLTPDLREKITFLTQHNQMLLKAGLAFIEEAYRFLGQHFSSKISYNPRGDLKAGRGEFLNLEV
ncbi:MAG: flagellar protein FlgN [Thermodesulfobacteria bacterium]|nr:flagellar protein FlgN [Thermodesulfobacteriota bacterium]